MLTAPLLNVLVALVATFLIGCNGAIIYRFWPEPWLTTKMVAVSCLLTYVSLSVLYGDPAAWRVFVGLCAVSVDAGSVAGIYAALTRAHNNGGVLVAYRRR